MFDELTTFYKTLWPAYDVAKLVLLHSVSSKYAICCSELATKDNKFSTSLRPWSISSSLKKNQ